MNKETENIEQGKNKALHIGSVMHRLWTIIDFAEVDDKLYIATEKLGAIVITENGIYPLNTDGMDKYFKKGA